MKVRDLDRFRTMRDVGMALLYEAGATLEEVGQRNGIRRQRVHQILAAAGVQMRARGVPRPPKAGNAALAKRFVEAVAEALPETGLGRVSRALGVATPARGTRPIARKRAAAREEVVGLWNGGCSLRDIAKLTGRSVGGIGAHLFRARALGVAVRPGRPPRKKRA